MLLNDFKIHLQESTGIVNEELKVVAFDISCFEVLPGAALVTTFLIILRDPVRDPPSLSSFVDIIPISIHMIGTIGLRPPI